MNPIRKAVLGTALVAATLTGGAVGASLVGASANAATPTTSTSSPAASSTAAAPGVNRDQSKGGHMANGITEKVLTGTTATKVEAAANAAVPGGTVERVETDAEGATYEAHMKKADGSRVTVKLDASFKVTSVETGRG